MPAPKLSESAVFYLKIDNLATGGADYFSLPLSEIGLDIFKNSLSALLGYGDNCNTRLSADSTMQARWQFRSLLRSMDSKSNSTPVSMPSSG